MPDTITHTYNGRPWDIPADLLLLQRDLDAAMATCERSAAGDDDEVLNAARARRGILITEKYRHPWLGEQQAEQRWHLADLALKDAARHHPGG